MKKVSPIKNNSQIHALKEYFKGASARDYLMFVMGISTALHISDMLELRVCDVFDGNLARDSINVKNKRNGESSFFQLSVKTREALEQLLNAGDHSQNDYLFKSRKNKNLPITREHASRIISRAAKTVGIEESIGTHSLRKTWGYWAFRNGVGIRLISEKLNHNNTTFTKQYIGLTEEDFKNINIDLNF